MKKRGKKMISKKGSGISRRDFLKMSKNVAIIIGAGGELPKVMWLGKGIMAVPASEGYLLVDTKKCQGCLTCMLACSLVHEGKENLSLSRIQVIQNSFKGFPDDLTLAQCRQCVEPACVEACPSAALHVDSMQGNVRRIDLEKCIGCEQCIQACPFSPSRTIWDEEEEHAKKCDLCINTPFWKQKGGPDGVQACVELCPVGALKFTGEIPVQEGDRGYNINLRGEGWKKLGFSTD
jgi:protein NrfC